MSRKANPITIGIFVTVGLALLAGSLIFLGAMGFFKTSPQAILYFNESVNGLDVGSQIKFKGVPVGKVTAILIRTENQHPDSDAVPVIVEFNGQSSSSDLEVGLEVQDLAALRREIDRGLRGRLEMQSFITGLLYIELDYIEDAQIRYHQEPVVYAEIPTVDSQLVAVMKNATEAIAKIGKIDFEALAADVEHLLEVVTDRMEQLDVQSLNRSITTAARAIENLASDEALKDLLGEGKAAIVQIRELAEQLSTSTGELTPELTRALQDAQKVLVNLSSMTSSLDGALAPDSDLSYDLREVLSELAATARSVRQLTDLLERHPSSVIWGRPRRGDSE